MAQVEPMDLSIGPINCTDCEWHECEIGHTTSPPAVAVVAVSIGEAEDGRVYMTCGDHTFNEIAEFFGEL
jgi:hypothetical protein